MEKILSIIIPTYNAEKFLDKGLTSYIMKDADLMNKLEVIVVNDGTPDNSVAVAQKYVDKYPHVFSIINKENGGHGSGINVGAANATGKYFKVIDADDWVETAALERLIKYLDKVETFDALITSFTTYDISKDKYEYQGVKMPDYDRVYNLAELMEHWDNLQIGFSFHGVLYNTKFYTDQNYKLVEKAFYEDQEYATCPLAWATKVRVLDDPMYVYRIGDVSQSVSVTSQLKRLPDFEKVLWKMMDFEKVADQCPPGGKDEWMKKLSKYIASIYHVILIKNPNKTNMRKYADELEAKIEAKSPTIYAGVKNKIKVFKILNKFYMSEKVYAYGFSPCLKFAKKFLGAGKLYK